MTSNIIYESHIIHCRAGATYILNSGFYVFLLWSLKIPQEQSESVNRRRTENTLAKRQKNREHIGQKTEEQRTHWPKEKGQTDKQRSTKHKLLLKTLNMLFLARIYQHGNFMEEIKEVRNSKQIVFRMGFVPTWTLTKLDRLCSTFAHIMIFFCSIIEVWCLGSWFGLLQFMVFKMGLHINIRVHIPQALNFK